MTSLHAVKRSESAAPPASDDLFAVATEFLLNHPSRALAGRIVVAALCTALLGAADWLAVFHLMRLKYTDAMGQPIGDLAGLVALSGATLVGYGLIGLLFDRPERWAKAAAFALYAVIVGLLALILAPVEASSLREVWASLTGGGGFGAAGGEEDAPTWFVATGLAILAAVFSLFGLVFLAAKTWLLTLLSLWHGRGRAIRTLALFEADRTASDAASRLAGLVAALDDAGGTETAIRAALRLARGAYQTRLETQIAQWQTELLDARLPRSQKHRIEALLAAAQTCLHSALHAV